ncbi:MAG: Malonyl CoA-acyl carrier protein transacylase [Desulfotomaculum sp. 46_296]|nr:MAG: Malonyl CoA-acyl carrier protein transacylase [Desulfotomaculum sp. 46_296]HAU31589.1 [acyl-carrier-protein] S-malonyltransferase [Desulfotomaculum sp.]
MKAVFLFPGQGAQYAGMGKKIYDQYPAVREIFETADEILGFSLSGLCFEGPEEELQKTINAQPAIFTVSVACARILLERGIEPSAVAGHSLGEYSALVTAGSISFADGVRLVRKRGQYMQETVPLGTGGMVAVLGLDAPEIIRVCSEVRSEGKIVDAANFNCPGQVVIAGENQALERAKILAKEAGAKRCIPLAVSAPFHSTLLRPAGDKMAAELAAIEIKDPKIPVVANVTADYVTKGDEVRRLLVEQVYSPVRWEESMVRLVNDFKAFIEAGPGNVLTGLLKKISRKASTANTENPESIEKILTQPGEVS